MADQSSQSEEPAAPSAPSELGEFSSLKPQIDAAINELKEGNAGKAILAFDAVIQGIKSLKPAPAKDEAAGIAKADADDGPFKQARATKAGLDEYRRGRFSRTLPTKPEIPAPAQSYDTFFTR